VNEPGSSDIDVSGAVGDPDAFDRIWTPHRMAYINGESKPVGDPNDPAVCPFCRITAKSDEEGLIVARGSLVYAVLNLYPLNAACGRHFAVGDPGPRLQCGHESGHCWRGRNRGSPTSTRRPALGR
jgi:hypothetical protein